MFLAFLCCLICISSSVESKSNTSSSSSKVPPPPPPSQPVMFDADGHLVLEEESPSGKGGMTSGKKGYKLPPNALRALEERYSQSDYASMKTGHIKECSFRGGKCTENSQCCGENCIGLACW